MDDREPKEEFVVRDRRRFSAEGESTKTEAEESKPTPEAATQKDSQDVAPEKPADEKSEQKGPTEPPKPLDFTSLVISLANTALFQLGFIQIPDAESQKDLGAARQTIDIIALLEEKTKGNLSDQEQQVLKDTLFQLRMAFVDASK